MDSISAYKQVVADPFSVATTQPKIPDDNNTLSWGAKRNTIQQLDFNDSSVYDILISPRYDSPITSLSNDRDNSGVPRNAENSFFKDNHPFTKAFTIEGTNVIKQDSNNEISKIRLVSQGTKISVISDDGQGWFEAFRFSPNKDANTYFTQPAVGLKDDPYVHIAFPGATLFNNVATPTPGVWDFNMTNKSGYVTDKLSNIHRYTWINQPTCKNIKFKDLGKYQQVGTAITSSNSTASISFQDWDYDVIWIRVHGKGLPVTSTPTCCTPTTILMHLVQNVECIFGEQNVLHSYMTKSPKLSYLEAATTNV